MPCAVQTAKDYPNKLQDKSNLPKFASLVSKKMSGEVMSRKRAARIERRKSRVAAIFKVDGKSEVISWSEAYRCVVGMSIVMCLIVF